MAIPSFDTVRELGLSLPGVVDGTAYGAPALKLGKKVIACIPTNKSAEINCIVAHIDFDYRAQLLEERPETYYITDHYKSSPTVLVRLSNISRAELTRLLGNAYSFVSSPTTSKAAAAKKRAAPAVRKSVEAKIPRKR